MRALFSPSSTNHSYFVRVWLSCINSDLERISKEPTQRDGVEAIRARGAGGSVIDDHDPRDRETGPFEIPARPNPAVLKTLRLPFEQRD